MVSDGPGRRPTPSGQHRHSIGFKSRRTSRSLFNQPFRVSRHGNGTRYFLLPSRTQSWRSLLKGAVEMQCQFCMASTNLIIFAIQLCTLKGKRISLVLNFFGKPCLAETSCCCLVSDSPASSIVNGASILQKLDLGSLPLYLRIDWRSSTHGKT